MSRWISQALVAVALSGLIQLLTILGAPPAWGCSCIGPVTSADHYHAADAVFTGTVTDRSPSTSRHGPIITVRFDVTRAYKGEIGTTAAVVSLGGGAGGVISSCDIDYRAAQWLVYADDRGRDGLYASYCGGTRPLPKKLPAVLGTGHEPTPTFEAFEVPPQTTPYRHQPPQIPGDVTPRLDYQPFRAVLPWVIGTGVGLLLLAMPGWLTLRFRRWHAIAANDSEEAHAWRA